MTPSDEFAARVAAGLRTGEPPVPDALLNAIAARTARVRQLRHPQMLSFARIVLQGGVALAVGWIAITMLQGMRPATGPLDAVTRDDFTLTLSVPRDTYRVGEAIEAVATLVYRGPREHVELMTARAGPMHFGVEREGGPRISPAMRDACQNVALARGEPLEARFAKAGAYSPNMPHADVVEWYLGTGRPWQLSLTPGRWQIFVIGHFAEGDCVGGSRGMEPDLLASVTVTVEDGPISATQVSGAYGLTLSVPRTVFEVGEEIEARAVISYSEAGALEISAGRTGIVGFGKALGHGHATTEPFSRDDCRQLFTVSGGYPLTIPYRLVTDSMQPGLWELVAVTDYAPNDDCSGARIKLRASLTIEIRP